MASHIYDHEADETLCKQERGNMAVFTSGNPATCPECLDNE